jgi:hydroxymethylpyrimidine kinase/phosphomethylpyrimidine kinase
MRCLSPKVKTLLTIAGFDPSSGAGVTLDLKVFRTFGFYGAAAVTAITVQNSREAERIHPLCGRLLADQVRALSRDMTFAGIKVGMAATAENVKVIAGVLAAHAKIPRVIDPILRASSGIRLLEKPAVESFLRAVRGKATVLTPNMDEAGILSGRRVRDIKTMADAARAIYEQSRIPCLVKGGHLEGDAVNVLFDGRRTALFGKPRVRKDVHGTGCAFSAALLCHLALGQPLEKAAALAADFTYDAIREAARVGRGRAVVF